MNIKERIRLIIDHICNADIGEYEILASLRDLLADLEAEPPKPTPEQLKAVGKVLDGDEPKKCKAGNLIWTLYTGASICRLDTELEGKLRWHLKDAPVVKENFTAVEPKAEPSSICESRTEPGLVSRPINTVAYNSDHLPLHYIVVIDGVRVRLPQVIASISFDHIECATGSIVYALQAFAENDPPAKCWFRK